MTKTKTKQATVAEKVLDKSDVAKTLDELYKECEDAVNEANMAVGKGTSATGMIPFTKALKDRVEAYNTQKTNTVFSECRREDRPMLEALTRLTFDAITVSEDIDTKRGLIAYSLKPRTQIINICQLEDFCKETIGAVAGWRYKLEKCCYLLALRVAMEEGVDTKEVRREYKIIDEAMKINEMEKVPTSNTTLLSYLQMCVDAIIYTDNGNGKNTYKVTSHDVQHILHLMCSEGKEKHTTKCATPRKLLKLISDLINKLILGETWALEYVKKDEPKPETAKAPATK